MGQEYFSKVLINLVVQPLIKMGAGNFPTFSSLKLESCQYLVGQYCQYLVGQVGLGGEKLRAANMNKKAIGYWHRIGKWEGPLFDASNTNF